MSAGAEFRRELARALADLHRGQRNRRGRRQKLPGDQDNFGRLGIRVEPPGKNGEREPPANGP